jgi:CubicO group peptidase (beta-lactamase class C family)
MTMRFTLAVLALASSVAAAQTSVRRAPADNGFAADRLQRIDSYLQQNVDSGRIAGSVALVLRDGKPVYERAFGWADKESGRRMTTDAMFRIASQTKALTSIAIMILVEEGKIALNNPVSRFIPTFARTTVATRADTGRVIAPATRQITIRDLLTHTAGISYGTDVHVASLYAEKGLGPQAGFGWYTADKDEPICVTMERLGTLPFVRQPGEAWVYGYNTDILGCAVERAAGMPLDEFVRTRITAPLKMNDTHFFVPIAQRQRLVTVYASDSTSRITRAPEGSRGQGHYVDGPRRSFAGGAGLVSTARDYGRFLQMLLDGGRVGNARLLSPASVTTMSTDQIDTLYTPRGQGFGFGFSILEQPGADNTLATPGTYGWGGAYASIYRVDPAKRILTVFMINQSQNRTDIREKVVNMVYQAVVSP